MSDDNPSSMPKLRTLDLARRVVGVTASGTVLPVGMYALDDIERRLELMPLSERSTFGKISFAACDLLDEDLPQVQRIVCMLPNCKKVNLDATALHSSRATDIRLWTTMPYVQYISFVATPLAGITGRPMFDRLDAEDMKKLIFLDTFQLEKPQWKKTVRKSELHSIVLETHRAFAADARTAVQALLPSASADTFMG